MPSTGDAPRAHRLLAPMLPPTPHSRHVASSARAPFMLWCVTAPRRPPGNQALKRSVGTVKMCFMAWERAVELIQIEREREQNDLGSEARRPAPAPSTPSPPAVRPRAAHRRSQCTGSRPRELPRRARAAPTGRGLWLVFGGMLGQPQGMLGHAWACLGMLGHAWTARGRGRSTNDA